MEEPPETEEDLRKLRVREFYQLTHILFTKAERLIMYKILKDYKRRRDVGRLVHGLKLVLRTYTKLELLKYVRYFVWEGHLIEFERLTNFHMLFKPRRKSGRAQLHIPGNEHLSVASFSTNTSARRIKDVRVFTLRRDPDALGLGFSVRGGSEHGLGIFVSEIDLGSVAERSGLEVGDKILEANNISLKGVASSSAVKVLTGSSRLKLVIQRTRKVPEWRMSREKTSWYDVHDRKVIAGEFEECGITHHIRGLETDVPERRVNLKFEKHDKTLGFNIRGGREYGLGIYVSKLDRDGLADMNGVRVGDQIIDVNGIPFENITHGHAVEVMKGKRHLVLTLRDVGRFPAYKELYAEYTWSKGQMRSASSMSTMGDFHIDEETLRKKSQSISDIFSNTRRPSTLHNEIFLPAQSPRQSTSRDYLGIPADDSDSLINIEQWTKDIRVAGNSNHGYESDTDNDANIIVHVQDFDNETKHRQDISEVYNVEISRNTAYSPTTKPDGDNSDDENDYAAADMVYAKINKHEQRLESASNCSLNSRNPPASDCHDSASSHEGDTGSFQLTKLPRKLEHSSAVSLPSDDGDARSEISSDKSSYHNPYIETHHSQRGEHDGADSTSGKSADAKFGDETGDMNEDTLDGALYSKVSKLSGFHTPRQDVYTGPSTSTDALGSPYSTLQNANYENDQTLFLRKYIIHKDNSEDESENDTYAKVGSGAYSFQRDEALGQDNAVNDETSDYKSQRTVGADHRESFTVEELEERLKDLEKRQASLGMNELNALSGDQPDSGVDDSPTHKKSKWKSFKNKIKGSLRIKSSKNSELALAAHYGDGKSSVRKRNQMLNKQNTIDGYNMASLEDEAAKLLNKDEAEAVLRHVKAYHNSHELERLVEVLLMILDKPQKLLLLRDIRGVIYPLDMVQFDNMVNQYEIEAYQTLSMKLHLPLNHRPQRKPRRNLMTTEIGNRRKRKSVTFASQYGERSLCAGLPQPTLADPYPVYNNGSEINSDIPNADESEEEGEAEDGHFHIKSMAQYETPREFIEAAREQASESKIKKSSPQKTSVSQKTAEEDSVIDRFGYLDHEDAEMASGLPIYSDHGSLTSSDYGRFPGAVVVHLSKNKPQLGLDLIEEDVEGQKEVTIKHIDTNGAANDDSTIEVGMRLLAVDRHVVDGCSMEEINAVLQRSYADKHIVSMKLLFHRPTSTDL